MMLETAVVVAGLGISFALLGVLGLHWPAERKRSLCLKRKVDETCTRRCLKRCHLRPSCASIRTAALALLVVGCGGPATDAASAGGNPASSAEVQAAAAAPPASCVEIPSMGCPMPLEMCSAGDGGCFVQGTGRVRWPCEECSERGCRPGRDELALCRGQHVP